MFLLCFQHKWMFLSTMQTLPNQTALRPAGKIHGTVFVSKNGLSGSMSRSFGGHNVAYQWKSIDQSNIVCEYDVNLSTNEKVITEKTTL